ncbi:hypothetical protein L345_09630 [Ophiophagus hannah]|uniref:Uncharacterized protein n=1 Tax=Ophiophagus hannah TaxID=8665 RepID=V8NRA8_OPHHA|nr:hypothetical protein L345_09630 [Ophiophagus hannah]
MLPAFKRFLLNAAWEKIKTDPLVSNAGFLSSWFQETMHSYLTNVNTNILDCMTQIPITCDGFRTIVQALDSVYPDMDNSTRQSVTSWIGRFLTVFQCQKRSAKEWIQSNWKSFQNHASYNDFTNIWSGFDGFATLNVLTASQLAQLIVTHKVLSNLTLMEPAAKALSSQDVIYIEGFLDELSRSPLDLLLDHKAASLALETILTKINHSFPDLCSPSLKDLFQIKLVRLLPFVNTKIMMLFPAQTGCVDFHDIYKGLNSVYYKLDPMTQLAVFQNRLNFLEGQLAKEGVACTFTASNSRDWLHENFGHSSYLANYSNFVHLNPSFNGFEVLDLLTSTQVGTLVVLSGILTDSSRMNAEMEAGNVMNIFRSRNVSELQTFLLKISALAEQNNLVEITNVRVRGIMLKGIFQILKPQFVFMRITDLELWFSRILTLYLPSITAQELKILPSPSNCTHLYVIVKGLDYVFDLMLVETKIEVAQWIKTTLQTIDCHTTEDWLSLTFQRFRSIVNLTDLMAIDSNFSGIVNLKELSVAQLAQLTVTEEVLSSIDKVMKVFQRLGHFPSLDALAAYWDEFNTAFEKPTFVSILNISMEVKTFLLTKTIERLHKEFPTFTDLDYQLWFEKRLVMVLPSVTAAILQQIPISISCKAYESVIAGIDGGFSEISQKRKTDILNYIVSFLTQKSQTTGPICSEQTTTRNWLLTFFRRFAMTMPYIQLVSYYRKSFDVYTVLDLLTPKQIGDMMIHSDTLTSISLAKNLVDFFQGSSFSDVQVILKEFTQTAIKHKFVVLPNLEVTQLLLTRFLDLASSYLEMYTAIDWNITFQQDLRFLAYAFNTTTLTYIIPRDYASFMVIVSRFSDAHDQMSKTSKRAVVLWIIHYLKEFKAYHMEPNDEWIHQAWGLFFHDATLEEVKSTHEKFEPFPLLHFLDVRQLIDFIATSNALVNVTTMRHLLLTLKDKHSEISLAKMDEFLTRLNLAIEQKNILSLRNAKVRLEVLSTILTNLAHYFYKFTALDYESWFLNKLKFLLPSINVDLLQLIPLDVSYSAYRAIFGSLDQVYPELSQDTSVEIYNLMKTIMKLQLNVSGTVFPGSYNSSQGFLQLMFYKFAHFARYTDFLLLYKDFNGFEVLSLLSPKQMGEMMIVIDAFKDEFLAIQILAELERRLSASLMDFMIEFNAAAKQKHLIVLPDLRIRDLIFRMVFKTLKFATFSAEQYSFWFGTQLQLFLTALSPKDLQLIPLDVDCQSHQHLVKAMEKPYNALTAEQKEAIHGRILSYLKMYQAREDTTCSPDANSTHWLLSNYGRFSALASIEEFLSVNVNFNAVSVLAKLSSSQLAELVITLEAWNDGSLLLETMSHLDTMADLARFLDQLNKFAAMELQSSDNSDLILGIALRKLAVNFAKFKPKDFTYWFQSAFQNVLQAVNRSQVVSLPLRISCDSYQQILKGFNNVYSNIPAENAANIFGFIKAFLMSKVKSGLACGHPTQSFRDWLLINLGNFSRNAEYRDLLSWNLYFDGMSVLEYLSPSQLASFTLESGVITNKEHMCQILAKLQNKPLADVYEYLDQFNTVAQKLGMTSLKDEDIQKQMLLQFLEGAEGTFSTFAPENWTHLLSTRLGLLLPSISEKEFKGILSYVSGCDNFRAVVSSVSQVYPDIPLANRKGIYDTLFAFLNTQHKITGSACSSHTKSTESWLQDHLGPFVKQAPYEDLIKLLASFSAFEIKDNLTSIQLAHVFFGSNILDNPDTVRALLMPLENRSLEETIAFVSEFVLIASQKGVMFLENTDVRFLMLEAFFYKMQDLLLSASVSQYKDWFQSKLTLWLPSMNTTILAMIPKTVPCGSFKAIMAGLDGSFPQMSPENCQDVYKFAIDYLTSKISQGGDPCIENTRGSLDWLNANFKHFSKLATYQDLAGLNPDFNALDAVAGLSPWQLADYILGGGVLRDTDKARKVFGALDSQDIAEFMDAFNTAAKQHHLSQLPHLEMRRFVLGEIFCHLSGLIHLFTPADYDTWFGQRLHFFLSSLNAQNLGFLPSDLSCDSLAAIVSTLKDHHGNNTFENPEDIYSFIKRVLHFHVQNSDSACVQGISTDKQWLERFLGPFTIYGSYSDFTALKSNFRGSDSLDLFSARALAELSVQSHTVYSTSAMKHIFQTIRKKADAEQFLGTYLDEFNSFVMKNGDLLSNINIRDALLMLSAEINFPQMSALSLKDMAGWLERLNLLLPGINGTMLELLPLDMSCPYFQAVVKALDSVYSTLSSRKRQDVYGFQKTYLTAQFAVSGSACDGGTIGIQDLLLKNFGKFCSMAKLSELQVFYPELNGVSFSNQCP